MRYDNTGRASAMVPVLMFCGLRASEMRGLRWQDVSFARAELRVRQRADKWQQIGPCKTPKSRREVPLSPVTSRALKQWRLASPKGKHGLVFPNGAGNVESYANIYNRLWCPLLEAAELADVELTNDGGRKLRPHFALHALRHVACSLWIEQGADPKKIQTWAGHASIRFTHDCYGHLWKSPLDDAAMASAIERSIIGPSGNAAGNTARNTE